MKRMKGFGMEKDSCTYITRDCSALLATLVSVSLDLK